MNQLPFKDNLFIQEMIDNSEQLNKLPHQLGRKLQKIRLMYIYFFNDLQYIFLPTQGKID